MTTPMHGARGEQTFAWTNLRHIQWEGFANDIGSPVMVMSTGRRRLIWRMLMGHGVLHICYWLTLHTLLPFALISPTCDSVEWWLCCIVFAWCRTHHVLLAALWTARAASPDTWLSLFWTSRCLLPWKGTKPWTIVPLSHTVRSRTCTSESCPVAHLFRAFSSRKQASSSHFTWLHLPQNFAYGCSWWHFMRASIPCTFRHSS